MEELVHASVTTYTDSLGFGQDHVKTSLLKFFIHLVSLVNLALKRDITSEQIERYKYHIQQYLSSSLELFQHSHLAPNHHMAIHLSDLLKRFGPVRAWWLFVFERLMGSILKGCHNNHLSKSLFDNLEYFCLKLICQCHIPLQYNQVS